MRLFPNSQAQERGLCIIIQAAQTFNVQSAKNTQTYSDSIEKIELLVKRAFKNQPKSIYIIDSTRTVRDIPVPSS